MSDEEEMPMVLAPEFPTKDTWYVALAEVTQLWVSKDGAILSLALEQARFSSRPENYVPVPVKARV